jgi:hypothetical protein
VLTSPCGQEPEAPYQAQFAPPEPEPATQTGWARVGRLAWMINTSRDPVRADADWPLGAGHADRSRGRPVYRKNAQRAVVLHRYLLMPDLDETVQIDLREWVCRTAAWRPP